MSVYLVIFGAAVRADGSASGSLQRRCATAVRAARGLTSPMFIATGGVGRHGPAEARVMHDLLVAEGVPSAAILIEDQATDTLQSVRFSARLMLGRGDVERVLVCTGSYHAARCVLLMRIAGFRCSAAPTASDRPFLGSAKWLRYVLKECLATPWDAGILLALKMFRMV